jgi:hypothetical protein
MLRQRRAGFGAQMGCGGTHFACPQITRITRISEIKKSLQRIIFTKNQSHKALEKVCDHAQPSSPAAANASANCGATARAESGVAIHPPCKAKPLPPAASLQLQLPDSVERLPWRQVIRFLFATQAQRPLPSMITATWRGRFAAASALKCEVADLILFVRRLRGLRGFQK